VAGLGGPLDDGDTVTASETAPLWLPPLAGDQVFAHQAFFVAEQTLGDGAADEATQWQPAGGVTFGYVDPRIMERVDFPATFWRRVRARSSRHLGVLVPFDLDELPGQQRYGRVSVRVRLEAPYAQVLMLEPVRETVDVPADGEAAAAVPDEEWRSEFAGLAAQFGEYVVARGGRPAAGSEVRPFVTPFGLGRPEFGWTLQDQPGRPLWHRNVVCQALVELDAGATELVGTLAAEATVLRRRRGEVEERATRPRDPMPFRVTLPPAPPA
jgi:hypothetical protein